MLFGRCGALDGTFSWGAGCPQGFFFFRALKLIFINLGGKNEIPLGVPPTPNKGTTTCPAPPKQHSGPLFGPASLRKMWRVSFVLMHASSGELWHSTGEVVKISREAVRSWILGHNVFLWSCKVKIYILGAFGALSPAPANLARARHQLRQSQTPTSKSHNCPSTRL